MVDWSNIGKKWVSTGDTLAGELELMIAQGELPRGQRLPPERVLAEQVGVSRTTLREALHALELKGLVSRRPGRGTVVEEVGPEQGIELALAFSAATQDLARVMELRLTVEPNVAALAASNARPADVDRLEAIMARAYKETTSSGQLTLDLKFHREIAAITGNPLLEDLIRVVGDWAHSSRRLGFQGSRRKEASLQGHMEILEAIREGNPAAARAAMMHHLESIEDVIARPADRSGY